MLKQIWEARSWQKAASEMQLRSTETRSGLRMITWLPRAIWHGCWRQLPTQHFEMDQRPSFWPSAQNLKAPVAKIIQLFCASLLRHTPRPGVLLRLGKLLNRHCKPHRSKGTPIYRVRCGAKSRCTSSACPTIRSRDDFTCPDSLSQPHDTM